MSSAVSQTKKLLHIGIVACSYQGASLCYQTICQESIRLLGEHTHPEVSMHTPPFVDYMKCLEQDDWKGVGDLMLDSANKLAKIGAQFCVCPDNTIHQAFTHVEKATPIPWLHIADVVATEAAAKGYKRLALTGTKWLVDSDVYPDKLAARGIEFVRPSVTERKEIDRIIFTQLVNGVFQPESIKYFIDVIARLKAESACDAVVLGCTEIPFIMNDTNSPLPTLDSTRLLAKAAVQRAIQGAIPSQQTS